MNAARETPGEKPDEIEFIHANTRTHGAPRCYTWHRTQKRVGEAISVCTASWESGAKPELARSGEWGLTPEQVHWLLQAGKA